MAAATRASRPGAGLGDRFGAVRLLRSGSRFDLFEACDAATGRPVVIKLAPQASGAWLHDVLAHEGRVLAALESQPNVLTCYEQLALADGRPALVLERCSSNLYDTLHSVEGMNLRDAVAVGIKLAGALETVHRAGVLHCDVRPRTVLVTAGGEPVLAGFDESVRMDEASDRAPLHHLTPHTAPELLEDSNAPTAATDVYGLASTLYELVAGRAAFRAYVGESPAGVIVRVLSSPVLPIVTPNVPLEISDLLTWSMSRVPADRPPSPAWLAEELGRIERREGWPRTRMVVR
jgi:serine/threonine protein kinase